MVVPSLFQLHLFYCCGDVVVSRLFIHVNEYLLADGNEVVNNLARSKGQSRLGVNEKLDLLQRAEEKYYQNENTNKQVRLVRIVPTLLKKVCSLFSLCLVLFPMVRTFGWHHSRICYGLQSVIGKVK